ncbi:uroporphyrinogen-III C-methyltransferase [Sphingomonas jeddahensis]|uniref:uroporphyrinogen-III C-methyltransferase n=1 Tax=Sphingomonas jeddahensis TaxID=1915074 RepID=A0A1V2EQZ3_9SPHN|nr:uroporphyrinogen-III C-methyltransferase [Sphingomonas jeddahensis]ONF95101.1 Siroheme synthase [Sphingomonas jeddahensis]
MPHDDFKPGSVWLVGAGPGDPELLTRKAERLIATADVVFYDALVGPGVLDLIHAAAERINVGKRSGRHSKDQATIDALIVSAASAGKRVVRLKGGDPAIFGRTAEEVAACRAAGITVRICPGITAASAAAAAGGASLTLRGYARRLLFVTAHAKADAPLDMDWTSLAAADATLAIYMGRAAAPAIAHQLMAAGRSPETPVLVVVNASLPNERIVRGRLSSLAFLVVTISDRDPAVLLVGGAVEQVPQLALAQLRSTPGQHQMAEPR